MAGRDGGAFPGRTSLLLFLMLLGCAGGATRPAALPPVSEVQAEVPKSKTEAEEPVAVPTPPTVVVIDSGAAAEEKAPKNLAEAAQEERERRAQAGKPVAVIDNRNLAEFSRGQKLTVAAEPSSAPGASSTPATDAAAKVAQDEAYWRKRGLEIRQHWREASDRIVELESKTEELRRRFYAADDPYLRDSQIKPEWDHALDELDATRREAERSESDLERFLDEGRQAGAFPGWLREGTELEPVHTPRKTPTAEPGEPVEVPEPQGHP